MPAKASSTPAGSQVQLALVLAARNKGSGGTTSHTLCSMQDGGDYFRVKADIRQAYGTTQLDNIGGADSMTASMRRWSNPEPNRNPTPF